MFHYQPLIYHVHPRAHTAHTKDAAKLRKKNDIRKKKLKKKPQTAFFSHFICIFQKKAVPLQPKKKGKSMSTYAITINERANEGKALRSYLQALGVLVTKLKPSQKSSYLRSQEDIHCGRVEQFSSSEEMFESLGI